MFFIYNVAEVPTRHSKSSQKISTATLDLALDPLLQIQRETREKLSSLQGQIQCLNRTLQSREQESLIQTRELFIIAVTLLFQAILFWVFK